MQGIVVNFGTGAFITRPREIIDKWPYSPTEIHPALSVQLLQFGTIYPSNPRHELGIDRPS
jgi:hypothetical protein